MQRIADQQRGLHMLACHDYFGVMNIFTGNGRLLVDKNDGLRDAPV
jgi:hypothetical protein